MEIRDRLDYKDDGPQIVKKGYLHRATIEFYGPENITPEQVEEYVSFELGAGSCADDNPLNESFEIRDVEYGGAAGLIGYTLWDEVGENGSRKGRTIHRRPGEAMRFTYTPPEPTP